MLLTHSPSQLESVYRAATVVANICVYAASDKNKPIAIIVPAEPALKSLASSHGIEGHGLEDLAHNDKLNGIVLKELQDAGKKGGLNGIEIIEGVVLVDEEWTPQNVSYCSSTMQIYCAFTSRAAALIWNLLLIMSHGTEPRHFCAEAQPQEHSRQVQVGRRQGLLVVLVRLAT